eukprot:TRINITY_DN16130_c0_g1_i17.p1 TRINITY_DN16130_c0_g1~~TRINITY_DN16130_c0_g1_i17.p1  ORF type:complete len:260 (-),score=85.25 TRINITY_DN16130_c0_g1_i17:104-883(-)
MQLVKAIPAVISVGKKAECEMVRVVPEMKYAAGKVGRAENRNAPLKYKRSEECAQKKISMLTAKLLNKIADKELSKKEINIIEVNHTNNRGKSEQRKTLQPSRPKEDRKTAQDKALSESVESSEDKKDDNSVLMASQESPIGLNQSKSPRTSHPDKSSHFKRRFVARRSPFSDIVDEGISEYLGNHSYISNKNKSSNSPLTLVAMDSYSKKKQLSDTGNSLWDRTTTSFHKKDQMGKGNKECQPVIQLSESIDSYDSVV